MTWPASAEYLQGDLWSIRRVQTFGQIGVFFRSEWSRNLLAQVAFLSNQAQCSTILRAISPDFFLAIAAGIRFRGIRANLKPIC